MNKLNSREPGSIGKENIQKNLEKKLYLIGCSCRPELLTRMRLGVFATYFTEKEKAENEAKYIKWLKNGQSYELELTELRNNATNCSEYRKIGAEKEKVFANAEVKRRKAERYETIKFGFDFATKHLSPKAIFDEIMSISDATESDSERSIYLIRSYYEVFMQEDLDIFMPGDLDVVLKNKNMSFKEFKLALARKIVEEYYGKERALKAEKSYLFSKLFKKEKV